MTHPNPKTIEDLRERLFATIDGVRAGTIDLDRARVVSDLAQVVVNSAKVEVEYLRATDQTQSSFIGALPSPSPSTSTSTTHTEPGQPGSGIVSITRHALGR